MQTQGGLRADATDGGDANGPTFGELVEQGAMRGDQASIECLRIIQEQKKEDNKGNLN